MDNNNLITFAAIEERKELRIDMENLKPHSDCCIYKVPKDLLIVKKEAYTPQIISIGPLHHGNSQFDYMEKQKIRYKIEFNQRINPEIWQELTSFIETNEQRILNCYEETPKFGKLDFITMVLYDAIFIIELFLRCHDNVQNDFLLSRTQLTSSIFLDMQLLENQLPYFILEELYKLAFGDPNPDGTSFFSLSYEFFFNEKLNGTPEEVGVKHFVDLRRRIMINTYSSRRSMKVIEDFPSALKLQESGVKFKGIKGKVWSLDIKFEKKKRCNCIPIPSLEIHELQIPLIEVYDGTESLIRNVMALEQCHYPSGTHVCNYIDFMDNLINTEKDVNLLIEEEIISNKVGDTATIKTMFNNLCQGIALSPSYYTDDVKGLKDHYKNPWNHAKATLKRVYFSNLWRGTGTVAAIVLLLLTLTQTIFSILQVV